MSQSHKNNIVIPICATKMSHSRDKKYQATILRNIESSIIGLFNSNGGKLSLRFDTSPPEGHIKKSVRKIEQKIYEFTGLVTLVYYLKIVKKRDQCMEIIVTPPNPCDILTLNYNLYLPTNEQVVEVLSNGPVEKVRDILNGKIPFVDPIQPGSHVKEFTQGNKVSLCESQTVQFKQLAANRTRSGVDLAERLIKSGKLMCYLSGFANYAGGHIYVGIDDQGIVQGEKITFQDQNELKKKINKEIRRMKWPLDCESGEGGRWQIHFEQVKNSDGKIVPDTFVIVIYVAQCLGGVFAKEPESYEIREGEAKRIDFSTWKKMIRVERSAASTGDENSTETIDACRSVYEMLTELLNDNCEWSVLKREAEQAQTIHDEIDVRLICLSKLIKYCLRRCDYDKAEQLFKEYKTVLPNSTTLEVFEVLEQYLHCLMERSTGNYEKSYEIAEKCFTKLDEIEPGIISAGFYVLAAIDANILAMKKENPSERTRFAIKAKELYDTAERHLQNVQGFKFAKADLKQKIYTNEAMFFSGSSLAGYMLPDFDPAVISESEAQNYLDKTHDIITHEKFPLSQFRDIQYSFAQSDYFYRVSKSGNTKRHTKSALMFAKRAEQSANNAGLPEMERYAHKRVTSIQNEACNCP